MGLKGTTLIGVLSVKSDTSIIAKISTENSSTVSSNKYTI